MKAARSVYLALAEIASDRQSETFDASQADVAHRAGLSVATVKRILPTFQKLGLIRVKRNSFNGIETRSTYTVIRGALAHHELALAQAPKTKRATYEECSEDSPEGKSTPTKESLRDMPDIRVFCRALKNNAFPTISNGGVDDIIIHSRTGERFNKRTKEFLW